MDIFIGSRMHSTIAAFSSNVITIPISYSRKFEGLFNSLNYPFVINGREETNVHAFDKIKDYVNDTIKLEEIQKQSIKVIDKKKELFIDSLECILKK